MYFGLAFLFVYGAFTGVNAFFFRPVKFRWLSRDNQYFIAGKGTPNLAEFGSVLFIEHSINRIFIYRALYKYEMLYK